MDNNIVNQVEDPENSLFSNKAEQIEIPNRQPYSYFFEHGKELLSQGLFAEAINIYTEAVKHYPANPYSYYVLGNVYSKVDGKRLQELECYQTALHIDYVNYNLRLKHPDRKHSCSILNDKQLYIGCSKIVDLSLDCRKTQYLLTFWDRVSKRISDVSFYLNTARKFSKHEKFEEAIAFLTKARELSSSKIDSSEQGDTLNSNREEIEYLLASVSQARHNKALLQNYNYKIISLGHDCLPRTVSTLWGLKPRKSAGELTCPFDLSLHPYESIVEAIKTNFRNYLNSDFLIPFQVVKAYDPNEKFICIKNTYYGCLFPHERQEELRKNNFAKFIEIYRRRIDNFYQYINNSPVLFVIYSRKIINIDSLVRVLLDKFPNLKFKVLLIISRANATLPPNRNKRWSTVYNIPCPSNYRWPITCEPRITYERSISEVIEKVIIDSF